MNINLFGTLLGLLLLSTIVGAQSYSASIGVPNRSAVCGPVGTVDVTLTNTGTEIVTGLAGTFSGPGAVGLLTVGGSATGNPVNFTLPELPVGGQLAFTLTYQLSCAGADLAPPNFQLDLNLTADGGLDDDFTSGTVEVVAADLSLPPPSPVETFEVYFGLIDTVVTNVVNGAPGAVATFSYCVSRTGPALPNLALRGLLVGGIDIAGAVAFQNGDFDCYTVTAAELVAAGLGTTFDQLENLPVEEVWEVIGCLNDPPDIRRRIQYGCQGETDCQNKPDGDFFSTPVTYETRFPDLSIQSIDVVRPACYAEDPTQNTVRITNVGNAPGDSISFRILTTAGTGMTIDAASVTVTVDETMTAVPTADLVLTESETNAGGCQAGFNELVYRIDNYEIGIGESVTITYDVGADCACNNCDIRNKYFSRVELRDYNDLCGNRQADTGGATPSNSYDAFIRGLAEGPSNLNDGQTAEVSYFITDMQLDWLTGEFPDAFLETTINIPCGMDYVDGSFSWVDRDNRSFPAMVTYNDVNTVGAGDELTVRFSATDRPGGFVVAGGANFRYEVTADCGEKDNTDCANQQFEEEITARFEFSTADDCQTTCTPQKIFVPDTIRTGIFCPNELVCIGTCDGIEFIAFDLSRSNLGLADADNDQIPDTPTAPADRATAQTDRYLAGDSLRATLSGIVRDADDSEAFDFGFIEFPLEHGDFTPLGATLTVTRPGQSPIVCPTAPLSTDPTSNRIILDFSVQALQNLGCGLPAGFSFQEGDRIDATLDFTEKNQIGGTSFVRRDYSPRFYVSTTGTEPSTGQCNPRSAQMTQVSLFAGAANTSGDFGACDLPSWAVTYDRYIGGTELDEFANEIRPIGLPDRLVFNKPAEFAYRLDAWRVTLEQRIASSNNIVNNAAVPAQFFLVNDDEVTLLLGDYFRSLSNAEVPPDEGYRVVIRPRIQGNCESVVDDYDYDFQFFEEVDENIYCTPEIARPSVANTFRFAGAAQLVVESVEDNILLCSGNEEANINVRNVTTPTANNAFLFPQPTGQVIINRVERLDGTVVPPNAFGIYALGDIPGQSTLGLKIFFTKNTCENAFIDFVAGWDCAGIPETIADATCSDPSRVALTSANSNVEMVVTAPVRNSTEVIELCEPISFAVDISSSDLGFVRDIEMVFSLPPNVTYAPGTFELSVPSEGLGGTFQTTIDPTDLGGNRYAIDISALDPILDSPGLVGSKNIQESVISIRFDATTECGYFSGERAVFTIQSRNSCGDPLRPVVRESGRIRTSDREPDIVLAVEPVSLVMNACASDMETLNVRAQIGGADLSDVDSIRILLPVGIEYVMGTYEPVRNAEPGTDPGSIRDFNGQTGLLFPLAQPDNGETVIRFNLGVRAVDVGQVCQSYPIRVDAFAATEDVCNGEVCQTSEIRGEAISSVEIQKPDLEFTSIDGDVTLNPTDGTGAGNFSATVVNNGFPLSAGSDVSVAIYEDVNANGSFEPGTDVFLFTIDETLAADLGPGETVTVSGTGTFPAGQICTVIGILDPNRTCTCTTRPSATFRPEIIYEFERDYEVCSGDMIAIGPDPVAGFDYRWLSVDDSPLSSLSSTTTARTTYTAPANNTGAPIRVQYDLRLTNAPCFEDARVTITVAPALDETVDVAACAGGSFTLPTTDQEDAANLQWTPSAGLTLADGGRVATVDNVADGPTFYTLNYEVGDGCAASLTVNLTGEACGNDASSLGDYVWFDLNEDGVNDANEPPVGGVTVRLINGNNGAVISTTTTAADGSYLFDNLPAGNYGVEFVAPDGFLFTTAGTGNDDTDDSDADPVTGRTPTAFLPLGTNDPTFDAGLIPDCKLEIDVMVADCAPSDDSLARRLLVTATWLGNPFAYDQFGDGNDTLDVMVLGRDYAIVVTEINGTATLVDSLLPTAASSGETIVTAAFRESSGCQALTMAPAFAPCSFDLALTKTASTIMPTPGPYEYGDKICMDITVINQGGQAVSDVQVFDSLPAGLRFEPRMSDLGWVSVDPLQIFTIREAIPPGEERVVTLCATIERTDGGAGNYTNQAEIASFRDTLGNDLSDFDDDSTPDSDFSNDPEGEDDNDEFRIAVYDLALTKVLATPPPYSIGDAVTFDVSVLNQGNDTARAVTVVDYLPRGLEFLPANEPLWTGAVAGAMGTQTTATLADPLPPGATATLPLTVRFTGSGTTTDYVNRAEIQSDDGDDFDSQPNYGLGNDPGGQADSPADNATGGDGSGTPDSADPASDADSADPALLRIDTVSLGSTVFLDTDDNGRQNAGEPGLTGVTVELLRDDDGNGILEGDELTPVATTVTGTDGNYYFGQLLPAGYRVRIPANQFALDASLEFLPNSSTDIATTATDNLRDQDDNGIQPGPGAATLSPPIDLQAGTEPEGEAANDTGGNQGDNADANANLTVDFGYVCSPEIIIPNPSITACGARPFDLRPLARIAPAKLNGTWTQRGNGQFLNADGDALTAPFRYDEVVRYRPDGDDTRRAGFVTLTLTTDQAGPCPPVSQTLRIELLKVDCGSFFSQGE